VVSSATPLASADLFDPNGTTTISFTKNIDIGRSAISVAGSPTISYGEKCQETTTAAQNFYSYYNRGGCLKVQDRSQLVFSFDKRQRSAEGKKCRSYSTVW